MRCLAPGRRSTCAQERPCGARPGTGCGAVKTPPDIDPSLIQGALRERWRFTAASLVHAPVGFGSHHWIASDAAGERRFVTVDDLVGHHLDFDPEGAFTSLNRAFQAARAVRESGLAFVVAPLASADREVLVRLSGRFAMSVTPYVAGRTAAFAGAESDSERSERRDRLRTLHEATDLVEEIAARESFAVAGREAMAGPWSPGGPYSQPARRLLADVAADLSAAWALHDRLVDQVRSTAEPWVFTHGEPHQTNAIWTATGPQLIDWDTALIAPAARDLWMLTEFRPGEDPALSLYRLRWNLKDIAAYVNQFRRPHEDNEDTAKAWRGLKATANTIGRRAEVAQLGRAPH